MIGRSQKVQIFRTSPLCVWGRMAAIYSDFYLDLFGALAVALLWGVL